ncbi:MAG: LysM domain-containing protein [Planctomycetota bacterium]
MTRESRLGLIIGFVLVLVVGVLISDHFSAAGRAEVARVDPGSVRTPDSVFASPQRSIALLPSPPIEETRPAPVEPPRDRPRPMPRFQQTLEPTREALADGANEIFRSVTDEVREALDDLRNGRTPRAAAEVDDAPGVIEMGQPPSRAGVETYRVQPGDTLWSIAERFYDDGRLHTELAAYNDGRIVPGGGLRVGATILVPGKGQLLSGARPQPAESPRDVPATSKPRTYTVQPGDTLSVISQRLLGTSTRWDEILALNSEQLDAPEDLRVGMELRLPGE